MKEINLGGMLSTARDPDLRVELDKKALFALASDTRMDILKALNTDRRTVSQLAEMLEVDKAAIHRHLKKLEEGGFVKRVEDHSFVYYSLSWKAKDIISPGENTRIVVIISCAFMLLLACIFVFSTVHTGPDPLKAMENMQGGAVTDAEQVEADHTLAYAAIVIMGIVSVAMLAVSVRMMFRPKQPDPQRSEAYVPLEDISFDD